MMMWGEISDGQQTPLVPIQGNLNDINYRDDILAPQAIPFLRSSKITPQVILLV